jgi:hypothetical protein
MPQEFLEGACRACSYEGPEHCKVFAHTGADAIHFCCAARARCTSPPPTSHSALQPPARPWGEGCLKYAGVQNLALVIFRGTVGYGGRGVPVQAEQDGRRSLHLPSPVRLCMLRLQPGCGGAGAPLDVQVYVASAPLRCKAKRRKPFAVQVEATPFHALPPPSLCARMGGGSGGGVRGKCKTVGAACTYRPGSIVYAESATGCGGAGAPSMCKSKPPSSVRPNVPCGEPRRRQLSSSSAAAASRGAPRSRAPALASTASN